MASKELLKLKHLWAKRKYSVLIRSEEAYQEIDSMMKNGLIDDYADLEKRINAALSIKKDLIQMIKTYHTIFEMVSPVAKLDEKIAFLNMLDNLKSIKDPEKDIRALLHTLAKRKNATSLLGSDFFDSPKKKA